MGLVVWLSRRSCLRREHRYRRTTDLARTSSSSTPVGAVDRGARRCIGSRWRAGWGASQSRFGGPGRCAAVGSASTGLCPMEGEHFGPGTAIRLVSQHDRLDVGSHGRPCGHVGLATSHAGDVPGMERSQSGWNERGPPDRMVRRHGVMDAAARGGVGLVERLDDARADDGVTFTSPRNEFDAPLGVV